MNLNIRKTIGLFSLLTVLIPSQCLSFLDEDEEVIKSFMPGKIRNIAVVPGQQVKRGDLLYSIEFMKMECAISSLRDGFIGALYFMVGQHIEKDMSLITILPFMPVEKEGDPMDVDELPLPTSQDNEPFLKDLPQNDLREIAVAMTEVINNEERGADISSSDIVITHPVGQSVSENEPQKFQQDETLSLVDASIAETFSSKENASDFSSPKIVITHPVEVNVSENEPQTPQQEETLPLVVAPIIETFDNEGEGPDIFSPTGVNASEVKQPISEYQLPQQVSIPSGIATDSSTPRNNETGGGEVASSPAVVIASGAKQSTLEHQAPQQVSTSSWIAAAFMSPRNDETCVSSSFQKVKVEELQEGVNSPRASTHLPWLTRLLLLAFLSFCTLGGIMPYRVKNILTLKAAENLNIPRYFRDAA